MKFIVLSLIIFLASAVLDTRYHLSSAAPVSSNSSGSCQFVQSGWGPKGTVPLRAEKIVTGLKIPWGIAFLPEGDFLITERRGQVRLVKNLKLIEKPVLQVTTGESNEGGLLGIALHPDFSKNNFFYVYYTTNKNGQTVNRVERFILSKDHAQATADRIILDGIRAAVYHDGGRIKFGPDGMLYVGTGDGQTPNSAQDLSTLNGKILRLTSEGGIPADNPYPGNPVFISGVRNVEAFDWLDSKSLLIADHGPSGELGLSGLDRVVLGKAGDNLGWPKITGCQTQSGLVTSLLSWKTATPPGGALVYRGNLIPEFKGNLLVGVLGTDRNPAHHLHRVVLGGDSKSVTSHEVYLQGQFGRLRDVEQGPDGTLYLTTSNCDSRGTCPPEGDSIIKVSRAASSPQGT